MAKVCFYLHIHQPWRIEKNSIFDIGSEKSYFETEDGDGSLNKSIFEKVSEKSYLPMFKGLLKIIERQPKFKHSISITGTAIEQMERFSPHALNLLREISSTGSLEFLGETYFHSLASLYSEKEFMDQILMHSVLIEKIFKQKPKVFRNTELIYTNRIAQLIQKMGYIGMLAEGADKILNGRSPTTVYVSPDGLPLLLKHYHLSDDIAFRFGDSSRSDKPLTAETFSHWINSSYAEDEVVNLFMDFETFGEHQWESTGIFSFFEHFVDDFLSSGGEFVTVSEAIKTAKNRGNVFDSVDPVSWADVDRDISAWRGNNLQSDSLRKLYELEERVREIASDKLTETWRKLQTSDHFYYMCTKWANDGDVHAYFSPYKSPHNSYLFFNNAITDFKLRLMNNYKNV